MMKHHSRERRWRMVRARACAAIVLSASLSLLAPHLHASPLSDLGREAFDKKMTTQGPSVESPFVPKPIAKDALLVQDLQLSGVALTDGAGYALISGQVVRLGDRIAGYHVKYIGDDQVILQHLDEQVVLRLQGGL